MRFSKFLGSLFFIGLSLVLVLVLFEINSPLQSCLVLVLLILIAIGCFIPNSYKNIQNLIVGILETIWIFFDF